MFTLLPLIVIIFSIQNHIPISLPNLHTFKIIVFTDDRPEICSIKNKVQQLMLQHFRKNTLVILKYQLQMNKTGTSQVGAISKAQKAQNIFFGKKLKFSLKNFFRKMSHSAKKCKRGTFFDL